MVFIKITLIFITLDILKFKKLMIGKKFTVWILCIFLINHATGYIEEDNENKYLVFDCTDENKELLRKYNNIWNGIKNKIEEVSSGKCDYEKSH